MKKVRKYPKDWFDIRPEAYADFGAMMYLTSLSAIHRDRMLVQATYALETPWRLGQYHIFRQEGFPRGYITFAGLSKDAEVRFAIDGQHLDTTDYTSGKSFWIVDLVAPFGQTRQIVDILKREIPYDRVRTNRISMDLANSRIVEWTRSIEEGVRLKVFRRKEFAARLRETA